jgi:AP-1-like transcription factor
MHARKLEMELTELQEKYRSLEISHSQLKVAYRKLRDSVEVLTIPKEDSSAVDSDTLRNLLRILYDEVNVKAR